jgi:YHS domain-containing protein
MKMKSRILNGSISGVIIIVLGACVASNPIYYTDLVCNLKVEKSDSYDYKYKGEIYHFHNYDCKQVFEMNPEKFILNKCDSVKKNATSSDYYIDPVCNMKVGKDDSFDYKFKGETYHFDSYDCKKVFEMNPEKFIKNKCDSVKR